MKSRELPNAENFNTYEWELLEVIEEAAHGRRFLGGTNIQIVYKNNRTGDLVTRHRIVKDGKIVHDHFRPGGVKKRS